MQKISSLLLKYGVPVLILGGSVGVVVVLFMATESGSGATDDDSSSRDSDARAVRVTEVQKTDQSLDINAHGTVRAAKRVPLRPEVSGTATFVADNFEKGAIVERGTTLVRLDSTPFEVALQRRKSTLRRAEAQLDLEQGRKSVAEREWNLYNKQLQEKIYGGRDASPSSRSEQKTGADQEPSEEKSTDRPTKRASPQLATREPQTDIARADVKAAEANLEQAKWRLEHTTISAPFKAYIATEAIDEGEYVSPQQPLATLVSTEQIWVDARVPVQKLGYIAVPEDGESTGAKVRVIYDNGEDSVKFQGRVARLMRHVDENSRMATVRIRVDDPFALSGDTEQSGAKASLLLGSFVEAHIQTDSRTSLVRIPRKAVFGTDQVFVFVPGDQENVGTLEKRTVDIRRSRPDAIYVDGGISPGEFVVTSPLSRDADGARAKRLTATNTRSDDGG